MSNPEQIAPAISADEDSNMLLTTRMDSQLLGIPAFCVRDVLKEHKMAPIPLANQEISGSINLRGRIVTVIDVRKRLNLQSRQGSRLRMFVVVEHHGQYYCLVFDAVEEVLAIPNNQIEKCPSNLSPPWRKFTTGVHRLKNELLVIIDIPSLLTL